MQFKNSYLKTINVVFQNGSNYNYHFIIEVLVKEPEGEFNSLGEKAQNIKPLQFQ